MKKKLVLGMALGVSLSVPHHSYSAAEAAAVDINEAIVTVANQKELGKQLLEVIKNHDIAAIQILLETGAPANFQDPESGNTALMFAIEPKWEFNGAWYEPWYDSKIIDLLIAAGANPHKINKNHKTTLAILQERYETTPSLNRALKTYYYQLIEVVKESFKKHRSKQLQAAIKNQDEPMVHTLLNHGASAYVNNQDKDGNTPLFFAIQPKWESNNTWYVPIYSSAIITMLIAAGANPLQENKKGQTVFGILQSSVQDAPKSRFNPLHGYYEAVLDTVEKAYAQKQHANTIQYANQEPLPQEVT